MAELQGLWRAAQTGLRLLRWLPGAKTLHGLHSPYVYQLYARVFASNMQYYWFGKMHKLRERLEVDEHIVQVTDFGAGGTAAGATIARKVSSIAKSATKKPWQGEAFFRLVNFLQPESILELGTNLGVSTAYMAGAARKAKFVSLEGCPQLAALARQNLKQLGLSHVEVQVGNIDECLAEAAGQFAKLDLVFIDANHRYAPTMNYFEKLLPHVHAGTVLVFDDIYWSEEMARAWADIKKHEQVCQTVDLFWIGLVLFKPQQAKEHFKQRWLPW